jgi:hypothetical protein
MLSLRAAVVSVVVLHLFRAAPAGETCAVGKEQSGHHDGSDSKVAGHLLEHLSDVPAHGLHVLRLQTDLACENGASVLQLIVYVDGSASTGAVVDIPCEQLSRRADHWKLRIQALVKQQRPELHRRLHDSGVLTSTVAAEFARPYADRDQGVGRWALFTPDGAPVTENELVRALKQSDDGTVYLIEGGIFMWPGIRVGHRVVLPEHVTLTTLSLIPRVFRVESMITPSECSQIIQTCAPSHLLTYTSH